MGRSAKYHTVSEQKAAKAARNARFNSTAHGRMLRQSQNHHAYNKQKGHNSHHPHWAIPALPASLVVFANQPLRATEHFTQASQGHVENDVPDLGITIHPYHQIPRLLLSSFLQVDDAALLDMYHTSNGNELRQLKEMGRQWYLEASRGGEFEKSTNRLLEELEDRIEQWEVLHGQGEPSDERGAMTIYSLCLEWGAKTAMRSWELETEAGIFTKHLMTLKDWHGKM